MTQTTTLSAIAVSLLTAQTFSVDYIAYSSQDEFTCSNADSNDRCILYCDESEEKKESLKYQFDCGNAAECQFNCDENKCFDDGVLTASNSNNLNILSSAAECMKTATIYLPNYGNATFSMTEEKSFKDMTVNAGINTQNIIIDCSFGNGDECKQMVVNAETAQYLEIRVGANSQVDGKDDGKQDVIINCPQNSNYNGPKPASCIIDLSNGGLLEYAQINTINGIPTDLWIYTGNGTISNVEITCNTGSSINSGNLFSGICVGTMQPTTDNPTKSPLTMDPTTSAPITAISTTPTPTTAIPTTSTTLDPTTSTIKITVNPTISSSISTTAPYPTTAPPTTSTALDPTTSTIKTTVNPTITPSISTTTTSTQKALPTNQPILVIPITTIPLVDGSVAPHTSTIYDNPPKTDVITQSKQVDVVLIMVIVLIIISVFLCICNIVIVIKRRRKKSQSNIIAPQKIKNTKFKHRAVDSESNISKIVDNALGMIPSEQTKMFAVPTKSGIGKELNLECDDMEIIDDIEEIDDIDNTENYDNIATHINGEDITDSHSDSDSFDETPLPQEFDDHHHHDQIRGDYEIIPILNNLDQETPQE